MKKILGLIPWVSLAVIIYEIYFLIQNGTAGNVNNIVIVIVLSALLILRFVVKSAVNIIKWIMLAAIVYAVITYIIPLLA